MKKIKQIAIYGKGGIGKSTTTSNISAALAEAGYKVLQFGCDPKGDSTNTLRAGKYIPSILDMIRDDNEMDIYDIVYQGYKGVYCVEAGGPTPGVGCAGRGIISAVQILKANNVFETLDVDVVIYDVLGDVVCGGFAMPIREGIADHVFTVSSSDFMSIYAANNLLKGIKKYADNGGALFGGIIANSINQEYQKEIVKDFATRTETQVVGYIPRSIEVTQSELQGKTVIEALPDSKLSQLYRSIAHNIIEHTDSKVPNPMERKLLRDWSNDWAKKIVKM